MDLESAWIPISFRIFGGRVAVMLGVEIMLGDQVKGENDKPPDYPDRS